MDPLSDVLATLRMRSKLYFRTDLRGAWGVEVAEEPRVARFHILIRGKTHIEVDGYGAAMDRGDLVLVPHGARHWLRDEPGRATVPLEAVLDATAFDGTTDLRYGHGDSQTVLVCGHFGFDDELMHPILSSLPPLVHLRADAGHDLTWLDAATRAISVETAQRPPGWTAVIDHVTAILLVQAVRAACHGEEVPAAIAAFSDRGLSRALASIHAEPSHPWTLAELGRRAGMSRTAFAERFRAQMGMPAMAYVTQWRLQRARRELLDTGDVIAAVAERAGYGSEASFCRAFQRAYGKPPGAYRRQAGA